MRFALSFLLLISTLIGQESSQEEWIREQVSQGYHEEFIDLVELIYGKGFLSQGGKLSVERMIAGCSIENKKILDIGSGLGGPAIYLAENYLTDITGLEPQKWLFERAQINLKAAKNLKGVLHFALMDHPSALREFADESFDVVLSKESILHIPIEIKETFFLEISRVLKPGGAIVIIDWMRSRSPYSEKTKKMMELDGVAYHLLTPDEYMALLQKTGFLDIHMENVSKETAQYSQENIQKIQELASTICEMYGKEVYNYCIESWGYQRDAFAAQELTAGIFKAKKISSSPFSYN